MPVIIDANINFGRPSINGISVSAIIDRFLDGDGIYSLAEDYKLSISDLESVFRHALRSYTCKLGTDLIDGDVPDAVFRAETERRLDALESLLSEVGAIIERLGRSACSTKN